MREAIENVLEAMREDYCRWSRAGSGGSSEIKTEMEENYCNGLEVTEGSRYWKITSTNGSGTSRSVSGFIVKAGDKKLSNSCFRKWFPFGNVLVPATV